MYSRMSEKTSQQFAKDKRNLLENPSGDLPYTILRQTYFSKSKEWFIKNIESRDDTTTLYSRYHSYCDWCMLLLCGEQNTIKHSIYLPQRQKLMPLPDLQKSSAYRGSAFAGEYFFPQCLYFIGGPRVRREVGVIWTYPRCKP